MQNKSDKYIIRKLISFKIIPEQIQDFINKITSLTNSVSSGYNNMAGFQMNYPSYSPNVNQFGYADNSIAQFPQNSFGPMMQNQVNFNNNSMGFNIGSMNMGNNQNVGLVDDSQLINNFAQMSLMNQGYNFGMPQPQAYNSCKNLSVGLDNGGYGNFEGQLSSIPPHMKPKMKTIRSNSISGIPSSYGYNKIDMTAGVNNANNPQLMGGSFLFDKYRSSASKDDSSF